MFNNYIRYPAVDAARKRIELMITSTRQHNLPRCQFVVGPTRIGKTDLLNEVLTPERMAPVETADGLQQTFIHIDAPAGGGIKSLIEELLRKLQDPYHSRGTIATLRNRLFTQLKGQKTRVIVIDEVHQLSRADLYGYADFLKDICNCSGCSLLLLGLPESLELPKQNDQLKGRCLPPIELHPFDWFIPSQQKMFRRILNQFKQADLARYKNLPIESSPLDAAIHMTSGGVIGLVVQLLDATFLEAELNGRHEPTLDDIADAFDQLADLWKARLSFNPFRVKSLPANWNPMPFNAGSRSRSRSSARTNPHPAPPSNRSPQP